MSTEKEKTREWLEKAVVNIIESLDLKKQKHIKIRKQKKNTIIEIKRFEVFFRMYITHEIRGSIRFNLINCREGQNDLLIYNPYTYWLPVEEVTENEIKEDLEENILLGFVLEAILEVPFAWEGSSHKEMFLHNIFLGWWLNYIVKEDTGRTEWINTDLNEPKWQIW